MSGKNSVWGIIGKGFQIYLRYIHKFLMYMTFPVIGQLLGLVLIFVPVYYLQGAIPVLSGKYEFFSDPSRILALVLIAILPGLMLMLSAFWKYLVAYSALNSMTQSALVSGKIYDFPAHNSIVTKNIWNFFIIWLVLSMLFILSISPLFLILCGILLIFFTPVFQIFTFEQDKNGFDCIKRSFELVKRDFGKVLGILTILGIISFALTEIVTIFSSKAVDTNRFLAGYSNLILNLDYLKNLNNEFANYAEYGIHFQISTEMISGLIFSAAVSFIVWGYTLPLRSVCWTLWYKKNANSGSEKKAKKSSKKQLDPEIIRRANLDNDEEV
ncbi:hypothetical protein J6S88_07545 [bacterium]|nr:hypothetical protein [bacterium]